MNVQFIIRTAYGAGLTLLGLVAEEMFDLLPFEFSALNAFSAFCICFFLVSFVRNTWLSRWGNNTISEKDREKAEHEIKKLQRFREVYPKIKWGEPSSIKEKIDCELLSSEYQNYLQGTETAFEVMDRIDEAISLFDLYGYDQGIKLIKERVLGKKAYRHRGRQQKGIDAVMEHHKKKKNIW